MKSVIDSYEVGQGGIDGGGFKVVESRPDYLYVQFESYKNGYTDDFEVAKKGDEWDVRSASRLGYLDYGVNAKRVNYIAKRLREEFKWTAVGVDLGTHREYAVLNEQR